MAAFELPTRVPSIDLPSAIQTETLTSPRTTALADRGVIAVGQRADLMGHQRDHMDRNPFSISLGPLYEIFRRDLVAKIPQMIDTKTIGRACPKITKWLQIWKDRAPS